MPGGTNPKSVIIGIVSPHTKKRATCRELAKPIALEMIWSAIGASKGAPTVNPIRRTKRRRENIADSLNRLDVDIIALLLS
jgi:hypothetical protein